MKKLVILTILLISLSGCDKYISQEQMANPTFRFKKNVYKIKRSQRMQVKCLPSDKIIYH
jgi:hypothetical protein